MSSSPPSTTTRVSFVLRIPVNEEELIPTCPYSQSNYRVHDRPWCRVSRWVERLKRDRTAHHNDSFAQTEQSQAMSHKGSSFVWWPLASRRRDRAAWSAEDPHVSATHWVYKLHQQWAHSTQLRRLPLSVL